jgi:hypothetical protein
LIEVVRISLDPRAKEKRLRRHHTAATDERLVAKPIARCASPERQKVSSSPASLRPAAKRPRRTGA